MDAPWIPLPFVLVFVVSLGVLALASAGIRLFPPIAIPAAGVAVTAATCSIATMAVTKVSWLVCGVLACLLVVLPTCTTVLCLLLSTNPFPYNFARGYVFAE